MGLNKLPSTEDLGNTVNDENGLKIDGFDNFGNDIDSSVNDIDNLEVADTGDVDTDVPPALDKDNVSSKILSPLDKLDSVKSDNICKDVNESELKPDIEKPSNMDINGQMNKVCNSVIPEDTTPMSKIDENIPGFNSAEALKQLKKLAKAGQSSPMRVLKMFMAIGKTFVDKITDKELMVKIVLTSLEEIYQGQIKKVRYNMPVSAYENLKKILESDFLDEYESILNDIDAGVLTEVEIYARAKDEVLPALEYAKNAGTTFTNFKTANTTDLEKAIEKALEFKNNKVVLQEFFDKVEEKTEQILIEIKPPFDAIKDMAETINQFLKDLSEKAGETAQKVSKKISDGINGVEPVVLSVKGKVEEVGKEIDDFLKSFRSSNDSVINNIKEGCNTVADKITEFFANINNLRLELDKAVNNLEGQVDEKVSKAFKAMKTKIEEMLGKITAVLENPEISGQLDNAKEGLEKFKKVIEDASLKPIFDLVVEKTGNLETKVEGIDPDSLGVPQKTALKVGAKVIEAVEVDKIIKPELEALFKELRDPIAALVTELKNGVCYILNIINKFEPGTIITEFLEKSPAYKAMFKFLEDIKPSKLLEPLKKANEKLTKLVEKLDPNILIEKLEKLYSKIGELLEIISPDSLIKTINAKVGIVTGELDKIKDEKLEEIVKTIKDKISLENLLSGLGLSEIADSEIWDDIIDFISGSFLDRISTALFEIGEELKGSSTTYSFKNPFDEIKELNDEIVRQIAFTKESSKVPLSLLIQTIEERKARITALNERRKNMLPDYQSSYELNKLLTKMNLTVLLDIDTELNNIFSLSDNDTKASLRAFKDVLNANAAELKNLKEHVLQNLVPDIFYIQVTDPANKTIVKIKSHLAGFADAIVAIRSIIKTLSELPATMDAAVNTVLDTIKKEIQELIETVIGTIDAAKLTVNTTIQTTYDTLKDAVLSYSPYRILNLIAEPDYKDNGVSGIAAKISAAGDNKLSNTIFSDLSSTSPEAIDLLKGGGGDHLKIVTDALNKFMKTSEATDIIDSVLSILSDKLTGLVGSPADDSELSQKLTELDKDQMNDYFILKSLKNQIDKMYSSYNARKENQKIRMNRLLLEANYYEEIKMSTQSIHPYIVEQVANLYPEASIKKLDDIYAGVIAKIKELPQELIKEPLDQTYEAIKQALIGKFDIVGLFNVLEIKLDGMDEDLSRGLDRVSFAFNNLIDTFDNQLSK